MISTKLVFRLSVLFLAYISTILCDTEEEILSTEPDSPEHVKSENGVIVLTDKNFDHVIEKEENILVEFYAPWCGHCQQFKPEYEKAAEALVGKKINLAKVDATTEPNLASRFDVSGYPTLKFFKNGEFVEDFDGMRNTEGVIKYMKKRADPKYKPPSPEVKVLTTSNFTTIVEKEKLTLVEFYVPWCGHCKRLAPEFEKAAVDLKLDGILLAKVDATTEPDLAKEYGVSGYPTLLIFRHDRSFEYKGPREHKGIVSYMKEQAQPPSVEVKKALEAKNKLQRTDPTVLAYFAEENVFYGEYMAAANQKRDELTFLHTFESEIGKKFGLNPNSVNVLYPEIYHSSFEDKISSFMEATSTKDEISEWLSKKVVPLVGQRTVTNMGHRYSNRPLLVIYYDVDFSHQYVKATQIIRKKILPVAHKHRDVTFAICDEDEFKEEIETVGLGDSGEEINVAIFGEKNVKYKMEPEEDFDADILSEFVQKFKKGQLKPYMKSQPIPKRQEGPVRTLVAKTFEEEVTRSGKDILIEFYAPWCGHCKQLEPAYKKVAKHFAKTNSKLVVAKMDATANDVPPGYDVQGFPTIYFAKATDPENPVLFQGNDRTFAGIKKFVEEHTTSENQKEEL